MNFKGMADEWLQRMVILQIALTSCNALLLHTYNNKPNYNYGRIIPVEVVNNYGEEHKCL